MKNKPTKNQIIFGRKPLLQAFANEAQFEHIYLKSGLKGPFVDDVKEYCGKRFIPLKRVPQIKLEKLTNNRNHQGVVGFTTLIEYKDIRDIIPHLYEQGKTPLILILDGITDVRNLGAIARSAEIFGCHALVIPLTDSAQINEVAIKTSAGSLLNLDVCRDANLINIIRFLQNSGVNVVASDLNANEDIYSIDFNVPIALVVGSEQFGVSSNLQEASSSTFKIPQLGVTDSLNVSVAAGIALYECTRQRIIRRQ